MLYKEIIAVCSQIHTKHTNALLIHEALAMGYQCISTTLWTFYVTYQIYCVGRTERT
jgi:hypothetical protein